MKVYKVAAGMGVEIPLVETYQGSDFSIPCLTVGEQGRGRELGVFPVRLLPGNYEKWKKGEEVRIEHLTLSKTRSGRPCGVEIPAGEDQDKDVILVLKTPIGYRGFNKHSFDPIQVGEQNFPSENIIVRGVIAQGMAGRMGSGEQFIVKVTPPTKIYIYVGGRRYGEPDYYVVVVEKDGRVGLYTREEYELKE